MTTGKAGAVSTLHRWALLLPMSWEGRGPSVLDRWLNPGLLAMETERFPLCPSLVFSTARTAVLGRLIRSKNPEAARNVAKVLGLRQGSGSETPEERAGASLQTDTGSSSQRGSWLWPKSLGFVGLLAMDG